MGYKKENNKTTNPADSLTSSQSTDLHRVQIIQQISELGLQGPPLLTTLTSESFPPSSLDLFYSTLHI